MTDEDKIKWFDETMKWLSQWNDSETMISIADAGADAVSDLFFDAVEQWKKIHESESK
tara:strand:+ start:538 stop:711 length:174 start_codon:yes stop_codon:yes gene_type:complete